MPKDKLERHYTPDALAAACVALLEPAERVLEPCVGGGAFVRAIRAAWPEAHVTTCDLDPRAEGHRLADVALVADILDILPHAPGPRHYDLILGNPPFSRSAEHVRTYLGYARLQPYHVTVAQILPMAYLCEPEAWRVLFRECPPTRVHSIQQRPWPQRIRGTGLFVWGQPRTVLGPVIDWR